MQPIETRYKGYRFRSRLEARWAVFFDAMGMRWSYETQGYEFNGVRYLPDFSVTRGSNVIAFYEVKPSYVEVDPKLTAFEAAYRAHHADDCEVFTLLRGDPYTCLFDGGTGVGVCPGCGLLSFDAHPCAQHGTTVYVHCDTCDFAPRDHQFPNALAKVDFHKGLVTIDVEDFLALQKRLERAALLARGTRFEHGESPT